MRYLRYGFLLLFLFVPFVVFGATCEKQIVIESVELVDKSSTVTETDDPSFDCDSLTINAEMHEVGEFIQYKVKVKNQSNKKYQFKDTPFELNSNLLQADFQFDGASSIKANEEKEILLTLTYGTEVESHLYRGGKYLIDNAIKMNYQEASIINPSTGQSAFFFYLIILVTIVFVLTSIKKKKEAVMMLLLGLFLIPYYALAEDNLNEQVITIQPNILINILQENICTYDGELVVGATFVNGQYKYTYKRTDIYAHDIEEDGWNVVVADMNSTDPITTPLCSSINDKPIVSMDHTFFYSQAPSVDLSSFDTSNVTSMDSMFMYAKFTDLDFRTFDTSHVTTMYSMFQNMYQVKNLDLRNFDTSNVTNMAYFFAWTFSLQKIDVSSFDTSKVTRFYNFIYSCYLLERVDLSNFDLSNLVVDDNFYDDFYCCYSLVDFKMPKALAEGFYFNFPKEMYDEDTLCKKAYSDLVSHELKAKPVIYLYSRIVPSNSNATSAIKHIKWSDTFNENYVYTSWNDFNAMLASATLTSGFSPYPLFTWVEGDTLYCYTPGEVEKIYLNQNSSYLFSGMQSLEDIELLDWFDTSNVTNMSQLFWDCRSLKSIDLSGWDTSHVTNMSQMFWGCEGFTSLDLSSWDVSHVTNMYGLFDYCENLEEIDVSTWDTSSAQDMGKIFMHTYKLEEVDLSSWNTVSATSFYSTFAYSGIRKLDLSSFTIPSGCSFYNMMDYMDNLTELITPKSISGYSEYNVLTKFMYPRGSSEGIKKFSSSTPTSTLFKDTQWS